MASLVESVFGDEVWLWRLLIASLEMDRGEMDLTESMLLLFV